MLLVETLLPVTSFAAQIQRSGAVLVSANHYPNVGLALWQFEANKAQLAALRAALASAPGLSIVASSTRAAEPAYHAYATTLWNLDTIDQTTDALNGIYDPGAGYTGAGVHAYIVDTGINPDHPDVAGRVHLDWTAYGTQLADDNGHGSNVAGIVGGTTYGVAKLVTLHSLKALGADGSGTLGDLAAALAYLLAHLQLPAVINLSLTYANYDPVIDALLTSLIIARAVITAASGNIAANACATYPCVTAGVLCVGATTIVDQRAFFSNYGSCVDIWAPGVDIVSMGATGASTTTMSGTSQAAPHVAGVAALYLTANPTAAAPTVARAVVNRATPNRLDAASLGAGSPNDFLYAVWSTVPTAAAFAATLAGVGTTGAGGGTSSGGSSSVGATTTTATTTTAATTSTTTGRTTGPAAAVGTTTSGAAPVAGAARRPGGARWALAAGTAWLAGALCGLV